MELKKKKGIGKRLFSLLAAVIMGISLLGGMGAAEVNAADKTDEELLTEAFWIVDGCISSIPDPVTNSTNEETFLNACRGQVSDKVTLTFTDFRKTNATTEREGKIRATLLICVGNQSQKYPFERTIRIMTQDEQNFENALSKLDDIKAQVAMEMSNEMMPEDILGALSRYINGVEFSLIDCDKKESTLTEEGTFDINFRMTAGEDNSQNFAWHFTIPKRPMTDAELLEIAIADATRALKAIEPSNNAYAPGILQLVKNAIGSAADADWATEMKIQQATTTKEGAVTGEIRLSVGSDSTILSVNLIIPKLDEPQNNPNADQEYIEKAKQAAYDALDAFVPSNDTTKDDIYNVVKNAIGNDINIEWYADFKMIKAQKNQDGLIEEGSLSLTKGDGLGYVSINLTIPALKDETGNKPNDKPNDKPNNKPNNKPDNNKPSQNDDKGKTDNTTKPQTTEKPKTTAKAVSPKTGDSSMMVFYIIALFAACGIAVVSVKRRHR